MSIHVSAMAPHSPCAMRVRVTFSIIGIVVGVSIFVSFGIIFYNWDAAIWGLASGVFAAISLGIHIRYLIDEWTSRPDMLTMLMYVGCFGQLAAVVATGIYIALAIVEHQSVTAEGKSYYVSAVWSFMTWKWAFLLFLYSRRYRRTLGVSVQFETGREAYPQAYQRI